MIDGHGTHSGYVNNGCRCSACRAAHALANKQYRDQWTSEQIERERERARLRRPVRICRDCPEPAARKSQRCAVCRDSHRRELGRQWEAIRRQDPAYREQQRLAAAAYRQQHPEKIREQNSLSRKRPG